MALTVESMSVVGGRSEDELTGGGGGGGGVVSAVRWRAPPWVLPASTLLVLSDAVLSGTSGCAVVERLLPIVSSVSRVRRALVGGADGCEELCWEVGWQPSLRRTPNLLSVSLRRKNKCSRFSFLRYDVF